VTQWLPSRCLLQLFAAMAVVVYQADLDFAEGFVGNVHDRRSRSGTGT